MSSIVTKPSQARLSYMENGSQQIGAGRVAVVTGAASWRGRGTRTSGGRRA